MQASLRPEPISGRMGSIFRQGSAVFSGEMLLVLGGYGFKIYLARALGADALGLFVIGESLLALVLPFVTWELHQAVFRFIPEFQSRNEVERLRRLEWGALWHTALCGGLAAVLLLLSRDLWSDRVFDAPALSGVLPYFALMLPLQGLVLVLRQVARGYKEVGRVVLLQTFVAFPVKVAVAVLLIARGWGMAGWLWAEIAGWLLLLAGMARIAWTTTPAETRAPYRGLWQERHVYGFTATIFGRSFLGVVHARLNILILGIFLDPGAVGIYSIALTTVTVLTMLQGALTGVSAPHLAELNTKGEMNSVRRLFYRVTRWNLLVMLPVFVLYIVFAGPLLALFGEAFRDGATVLRILAVGQLINIGCGPVGTLLTMVGRERVVLWASVAHVIPSNALLLVLIPLAGTVGVALAWTVGITCFYGYLYLYVHRQYGIDLLDGRMAGMLASAGALMVTAWSLSQLIGAAVPPLYLVAGAFAGLYGCWIAWTYWRLADGDDHAYVRNAVQGLRGRPAPRLE